MVAGGGGASKREIGCHCGDAQSLAWHYIVNRKCCGGKCRGDPRGRPPRTAGRPSAAPHRAEGSLNKTRKYTVDNPIQWELDLENPLVFTNPAFHERRRRVEKRFWEE